MPDPSPASDRPAGDHSPPAGPSPDARVKLPLPGWSRATRAYYHISHEVAVRLLDAGHLALFAGGCVRDIRLGREPKDFDIATAATPEQVQALFPKTRAVGAHFGVVLVRSRGLDVEVATFRRDGPYEDGRRPTHVVYSSPAEDAARRDFTINGLFLDPRSGRVIDHVGGDRDLVAGLVRAIGDPSQRFAEDYLRLLRALRFAATLGFQIEPATWRALRGMAPRIEAISPERVRDELSRMLTIPGRRRAVESLVDSGLAAVVLPELPPLRGCEQPPQFHPEGDVFVHTMIMLDLLPDDAPLELAWATLLHDIGKPATQTVDDDGRIRFNGHDALGADMARAILTRLRYPNKVIDAVVTMVARHMQFMHVRQMRTSRLKRFMAEPTFEQECELHRVDCTSSHGKLDNLEYVRQRRREFESEPLVPPPLLRGHDLIALGQRPGPGFKQLLEEAQNLQLEGRLTNRQQALEWLRRQLSGPGEDRSL